MDNFTPVEATWNIGGKEYVQRPLGLDRIGTLFAVLAQTFQSIGGLKELEQWKDLDTNNTDDLLKIMVNLLQKAPEALPKIVGVVLDAPQKDIAHVGRYTDLPTLMQIVTEFVRQNDLQTIKESFLALKGTFQEQQNKSSMTEKPE